MHFTCGSHSCNLHQLFTFAHVTHFRSIVILENKSHFKNLPKLQNLLETCCAVLDCITPHLYSNTAPAGKQLTPTKPSSKRRNESDCAEVSSRSSAPFCVCCALSKGRHIRSPATPPRSLNPRPQHHAATCQSPASHNLFSITVQYTRRCAKSPAPHS